MTFLIAVVMLGLIIFVHELGHFLTAKLFKMPVSEFSIGMGPQVFSVDTKNTAYSFRAIPIGGYVNIEGMEVGSSFICRSFYELLNGIHITFCSS